MLGFAWIRTTPALKRHVLTFYGIFQCKEHVTMPLWAYCLFVSDTCTALPNIDNLETTETLPVNYGTVLSVECNTGHTLSGDSSLTCERGTVFTYINQPICNIGKYIFFQDFSWFKAHFQSFQRHCCHSNKAKLLKK